MKVKKLINTVLDSPFYLEMSFRERKEYITAFTALYMNRTVPGYKEKKGGGNMKACKVMISVVSLGILLVFSGSALATVNPCDINHEYTVVAGVR